MENLLTLKIGSSIDFKLFMITYNLYRISGNKYEITDLSSGWNIATINKSELNDIVNGKLSLLELSWN
jgi:hypothetical protein